MTTINTMTIGNLKIPVHRFSTIVVGAGAAGLNAADSLFQLGHTDIAILTDDITASTSRNTGSDKQTYYKLTLAGSEPDSVREMAQTLFSGGAMHGDIALVEAALSARGFLKLVELGVPFPHNSFGEYVGYKTDHDPRQRATSAGPLTSKFMTEKLHAAVIKKNIPIFDRFLVVAILTEPTGGSEPAKKCVGVLAINLEQLRRVKYPSTNADGSPNYGLTIFRSTNVIFATGGPAGMYRTSVYPECHFGMTGTALAAGARAVNLTESQFGIASLKPRWNLSGTYQQVIPRYISTNQDGLDAREFLFDSFPDTATMIRAVFLKGYQWPFDPRKIPNYGSSLIDLLVYQETETKGRRVFLDFRSNPGGQDIDFSTLDKEVLQYLTNSGATFGTPIQRLAKINPPAVELYQNFGVDLASEMLEIAVCAQHTNGGLRGNHFWESNLQHFFPVGECNGSFGVYRPGGSALNSTQVGSLRAAQYIVATYPYPSSIDNDTTVVSQVSDILNQIRTVCGHGKRTTDIQHLLSNVQNRMTRYGAHIRSAEGIQTALTEWRHDWATFERLSELSPQELPDYFRLRDVLISQLAFLTAMKEYIRQGGGSRGSYLILETAAVLDTAIWNCPEFQSVLPQQCGLTGKTDLTDQVCEVEVVMANTTPSVNTEWLPVRPLPETDDWFENVWRDFRNGKNFP